MHQNIKVHYTAVSLISRARYFPRKHWTVCDWISYNIGVELLVFGLNWSETTVSWPWWPALGGSGMIEFVNDPPPQNEYARTWAHSAFIYFCPNWAWHKCSQISVIQLKNNSPSTMPVIRRIYDVVLNLPHDHKFILPMHLFYSNFFHIKTWIEPWLVKILFSQPELFTCMKKSDIIMNDVVQQQISVHFNLFPQETHINFLLHVFLYETVNFLILYTLYSVEIIVDCFLGATNRSEL